MSKGSKQRPGQGYGEGYDRIFGKKPEAAEPDGCQCKYCKVSPHWSYCAVHNEPAHPIGPCDCGGFKPEEPKKD
jgi:hypothetical protein